MKWTFQFIICHCSYGLDTHLWYLYAIYVDNEDMVGMILTQGCLRHKCQALIVL